MYDTGHLKAPSLTHSLTHPIEEHNEEILAWTLGKFNHQKLNNIYILLVLTICTCLSDGSSCLMVSPPVRRRRVRYLTIHVTGGSLVCTTHLQYRIPLCRFFIYRDYDGYTCWMSFVTSVSDLWYHLLLR